MVDKTDWYDDFMKEEKTDEEIVELTDIVEGGKDPSTQEDIIELTDIADVEQSPSTQEDIIELTDIADVEQSPSTQEDIIELTDIVEDDNAVLDMDSIKKDGFETGENLELEDDISFKEGLEPEMGDPADEIPFVPYVTAAPALEVSVSQEQLETALERVIEKRFADKIDILLIEGMEKAIKKEIAEIKERLQKDLDLMENF